MSKKFDISILIRILLGLTLLPVTAMAQSFSFNLEAEPTYDGEPKSVITTMIVNGVDIRDQITETYEDLTTGQIFDNGDLPINAGRYRAEVILPSSVAGLVPNIPAFLTIKAHDVNVILNPISTEFGNSPSVSETDIVIVSAAGLSQLPTDWVSLQEGWKNSLINNQSLFDFGGITSTSPVGTTGSVNVDLSLLNSLNAPNYNFTLLQSGLATVSKAILTVRAVGIFHPYSTPDPTPSYVIEGVIAADGGTESSLRASGGLSGEPSIDIIGASPSADIPGAYPGTVVATAGNLTATNYVFEFENADLTILKGNQDISSIPTTVNLSFRDPDYQLPSTIENSGLSIEWAITDPTGIVQLNADNSLTALSLGTTIVRLSQAGNDLFNPAPTVDVAVTVGQAVFDLDADFPFYLDRQFTASEVYDLSDPDNFKSIPSEYSDLLGTQADFQNNFSVSVLFGVAQELVTASGYELTQVASGPVVVQVTLVNPNFAAASTFRAIEFTIPPPTDSGNGGTTDPTDPTDPNDPGDNPDDPTEPTPDPITNPGVGKTITEGTSLGNNWYELDWFGIYYWDKDANPNHIWHEEFGWLYVPDPYLSSNPVWMYSYATLPSGGEMGWLYTQAVGVEFPFFGWQEPVTKDTHWLWYSQRDPDTTNGRVFWHFDGFEFLIVQAR